MDYYITFASGAGPTATIYTVYLYPCHGTYPYSHNVAITKGDITKSQIMKNQEITNLMIQCNITPQLPGPKGKLHF